MTERSIELAGAVLTGGASRRMGRDKAFVEVDGVVMVRRVADSLVDAGCRPVIAVGGNAVALAALGLTTVSDRFPGEGPLGAIITALGHRAGEQPAAAAGPGGDDRPTLVVATDLPWLDAQALEQLVTAAAAVGVDGSSRHGDVGRHDLPTVVMATTDRREPLCAVWWPSAIAPLEERFHAGERAVHRALDGFRVIEVALPAAALTNVNTPADLAPAMVRTHERAGSVPRMSIEEVSVDVLAAALERGARVVDVRETDEYLSGHVPTAVHVALGTVPDHVDAFRSPDDSPTYVICKAGGRSLRAAEFLADQGIVTINIAGGTMAWIQAGHPVVTGDQPS